MPGAVRSGVYASRASCARRAIWTRLLKWSFSSRRETCALTVATLDCDGAERRNDSGPALSADSLQVGQNMYLTDRFTATGSGSDGAVRLPVARIGGQLD